MLAFIYQIPFLYYDIHTCLSVCSSQRRSAFHVRLFCRVAQPIRLPFEGKTRQRLCVTGSGQSKETYARGMIGPEG